MTTALTVSVIALVLVGISVALVRRDRGAGAGPERRRPGADVPPPEPGAEGMLVTAPGDISPGPSDPAESRE